jgi:multiple sugar transport system ATP-binding protein
MARVTLDHVSKSFGDVPAVQHLSCSIADGEFVALLGPSGCGKTNIGMVFQSYALYPHLSVYENLAFPLRVQRQSRAVIEQKVQEIAELVQLHTVLQRKPAQLSGGQQQRVALGRALIKAPDVLLLDEPLSNLDAELRLHMRAEIKRLQRTLHITTVLVTHDQIEALSMADRILVLRGGHLQQLAEPQTLYNFPANQFVARFIGSSPMNFLTIEVRMQDRLLYIADTTCSLPVPETLWTRLTAVAPCACQEPAGRHASTCTVQLLLGLRPEDILLHQQPVPSSLPVTVTLCEPLGREVLVSVTCGAHPLKVFMPAPCNLTPAMPVWLDVSRGPYHLFDPQSGAALPISAQM